MSEIEHHLTLPLDQFGVQVDDVMDERRLLWLVNQIGEQKLRRSVAKYAMKWPESRPFVSLLLKWYGLRVPTFVYAPQPVPIYGAYMLVLAGGAALKIGYSGGWVERAWAFVPNGRTLAQVFDLDLSAALPIGPRPKAYRIEQACLRETQGWQCAAPTSVHPIDGGQVAWSSGRTEWRNGVARERIVALLREYDRGVALISLREAIAHAELFAATASSDFASSREH